MKFWRKKYLKILLFSIFKKFIKIKTTFHQYQKLYSTPPWLGAHTCKVSRKYSHAFLSYSAKTKRDGRTDGQMGGVAISPGDGRTDRRGALQYIPGLRRRREITRETRQLGRPRSPANRFPLSLSTIWGNHLPVNFMLKFPTCISTIWRNLLPHLTSKSRGTFQYFQSHDKMPYISTIWKNHLPFNQ